MSAPLSNHSGAPRTRLVLLGAAAIAAASLIGATIASGQPAPGAPQRELFLRIGTGASGTNFFAAGGLLASVISRPHGAPECRSDRPCGVAGLLALAVTTGGSQSNADALLDGRVELALVQADVAAAAAAAKGGAALRVLAQFPPNVLHLIVPRESPVTEVKELAGKRMSIGAAGAASATAAPILLRSHGVRLDRVEARTLSPFDAANQFVAGELDALLLSEQVPARTVAALADRRQVDLVPIDGAGATALVKAWPLARPLTIPAGAYPGVGPVESVGVPVLLVTLEQMPDELAGRIVEALLAEGRRRDASPQPDPLWRALLSPMAPEPGLGIMTHEGARAAFARLAPGGPPIADEGGESRRPVP